MHSFEGITCKEKGTDKPNECCNTEVLYLLYTWPLNIIEIHRKLVFNELWFQVLNNRKILQWMKQVVRVASDVLRKPNTLLLQSCVCLVELYPNLHKRASLKVASEIQRICLSCSVKCYQVKTYSFFCSYYHRLA